jgi:hypothetical protein
LREGDRPARGRGHGEVGRFLADLRYALLFQGCLLSERLSGRRRRLSMASRGVSKRG